MTKAGGAQGCKVKTSDEIRAKPVRKAPAFSDSAL